MIDNDWFDYENYMELYEAVCFFNRIGSLTYTEEVERLGITESVYKAIVRILTVNNLLENEEERRYILDNIINKNRPQHYAEMFDKAISESQFFFGNLSELEYEIYSRYNFEVTFETGKQIAEYNQIDLTNKKALELGGNSGGLGSALLKKYKNCSYTIVDTEIPCRIGNEFNESNKLNIKFIEGDVFDLKLSDEFYDYIIIMNLLHDFDDVKCSDILRNCVKYCDENTKFLIIEDILTSEFESKEVIMHGLRLAVECRGGKQRTIHELADLFSNINYKPEKIIKLNEIHTMVVMGL